MFRHVHLPDHSADDAGMQALERRGPWEWLLEWAACEWAGAGRGSQQPTLPPCSPPLPDWL